MNIGLIYQKITKNRVIFNFQIKDARIKKALMD